ncbi:MAG TPA: hypothetical protein VMS18_20270 [Candidatus Binatia bacterium]|nr:hypothetical protein [Candidatus Binatia bacterium]
MASELTNAFPHPGDADTSFAGGFVENLESFWCNAFTVVPDFELNFTSMLLKTDRSGRSSGMAMNIGETFLQHAKEHQFAFSGRSFQIRSNLACHLDPATTGETFSEPAGCRGYPRFIEQRRVQQVGGRADFLECSVRKRIQVVDKNLESGALILKLPNQGDGHLHCGESLTGSVMQFAGDVPSFFVLQSHQTQGQPTHLFLGMLADVHFGSQARQRLRQFVSPNLYSLLQLIMRFLQTALSPLPFTDLTGKGSDTLVQSQLLAAIGLSKRNENTADQKTAHNSVNFSRASRQERMAWIDEPVEDSHEAKNGRQYGGSVPAHNRTVGHRNIDSDVEGDVPQNRVQYPAEYYRENSRQGSNRIAR